MVMDNGVEQAVLCSLDPSVSQDIRQQALNYCEQVKASTEGWRICLSLFVRQTPSRAEVRFFCLQVVEVALRSQRIDVATANTVVREGLMSWLSNAMSHGALLQEPIYVKNKLAQVLVLLMAQLFVSHWPTFFDDLIAACRAPETSLPAMDILLRVSLAFDDEIACQLVLRSGEQLARDSAIKDAMRSHDVPRRLVSLWIDMVKQNANAQPELAAACFKVIGLFTAWIDIHLVANEAFLSLLLHALSIPPLKLAACECLTDMINKGMKAVDKIQFMNVLHLENILQALDLRDVNFSESVAKLLNTAGVQLCHSLDDESLSSNSRELGLQLISLLFPFLLQYFSLDRLGVTIEIHPFALQYLQLMKRLKKEQNKLNDNYLEQLRQLLSVVVQRMRYPPSFDFADPDEDDIRFLDLRKSLRVLFDNIAAVADTLVAALVSDAVQSTLSPLPGMPSFVDVELALHLLFIYGETSQAPLVYVQSSGDIATPTTMGTLVNTMLNANAALLQHPAAAIAFCENIIRYSLFNYFDACPDQLPLALNLFVGSIGLHHTQPSVQLRAWYLFYRLVKLLRGRLISFVDQMLTAITDLLRIPESHTKVSIIGGSEDEQVLDVVEQQQYLYETAGLLIGLLREDVPKQMHYIKAITTPLLTELQVILNRQMYKHDTPERPLFAQRMHDVITAAGSLSKGLPDEPTDVVAPLAPSFKDVFDMMIRVLETLPESFLIRKATIFTFQRLLTTIGAEVVPFIGPLIRGMLQHCEQQEMVDLMPVISMTVFKYKDRIITTMEALIQPIVQRLFYFLDIPVTGTDDAVRHQELRKLYLSFLISLFSADIDFILISEMNLPLVATLLQSVVHWAVEGSDVQAQRTCFTLLNRMVQAWHPQASAATLSPVSPTLNASNNNNLTMRKSSSSSSTTHQALMAALRPPGGLTGFDTFVDEQLTRACFEAVLKPTFQWNDAQSHQVVIEICQLQKTIFKIRKEAYAQLLVHQFFPAVFPRASAQGAAHSYVEALSQSGDIKKFKKFFTDFVQQLRSAA